MTYDCYCDYDPPEFYDVVTVKSARKGRKCYECGRAIAVGESYVSHRGKWDGVFSTFDWCEHCGELSQWAIISVPCFCHTFGNLHEELQNMVREVARETPGFFMEYGRRIIKLRRAGGKV